jgi:cold shock CspA family protein
MLGKIERWDAGKGYGFIADKATGKSYFAHRSALEKPDATPARGQEAMFDIERSPKSGRTQAANIVLL